MVEEALPAALAANLDEAFECLVLAFQDRLFAFARRLGHAPADAEEIAQDAFVRAYHALAGYPPERIRELALRAWLYQITLNVARNRVRRKRVATVPIDGDDERADGAVREPADDAAAEPEPTALREETRAELSALVAALPDRYRVPVMLRHVEGLGYAEVALALQQPVGTVKANVHRGVQRLRAALAARAAGGTCYAGV